ncbi:MAG: hypothetical protein J6L96_02580 [Clostridia bacterium]|nr:hypothetical protein [Clostridia bacterium]
MRVRKELINKFVNTNPKDMAILILIIGLFLGSIFTFGQNYWQSKIELSEAIQIEAMYESYDIDHLGERNKQIFIYSSDYARLTIDGMCINDELVESLSKLQPQTKIYLTVHPNSDTILDMKTDDSSILNFDEVQRELQVENIGFFILGILLYMCAIFSAVYLLIYFYKKFKSKKSHS